MSSMDMEEEAAVLMARIRMVRSELEAGRLTPQQIRLYRELGRQVEQITRRMDEAADAKDAELLWSQGAAFIRAFLDEHFPQPTRH